VVPAHGYALCAEAEALGVSLRELLTGVRGPLTCMEWFVKKRYRTAQNRLRQQAT
jgi:hypothetical protein